MTSWQLIVFKCNKNKVGIDIQMTAATATCGPLGLQITLTYLQVFPNLHLIGAVIQS